MTQFRQRGTFGVALVAALAVSVGVAAAQDAPGAGVGPADPPPVSPEPAAPNPPAVSRVVSFSAPRSVPYGQVTQVSGRVAPARRVSVRIERLRPAGWRTLTTTTSNARGRIAVSLPLRESTTIRALVVAPGTRPGRSVRVRVQRRVAVSVTPNRYEAIAGRPFAVTGTVVPAAPGERAIVEGSVDGRPYVPLGRLTVRAGRVQGTVTPTAGGRWRFRLVAPGARGATDVSRSTPTVSQNVFDVNPHGVPRSAPVYLVQKISEMQLYYYERGQLVRVFPVVFGKPSTPTPTGLYRVYSKTAGPGAAFGPLVLWYHRGYGIHGTNQEYLLARSWRYYSHGCTRNYNANIRWLWDRVPVGTPVRSLA